MAADATSLVRRALEGTGIELVGSCGVAAYDACAPGASAVARSGSREPAEWSSRAARVRRSGVASLRGCESGPELWSSAHPYDEFVAGLLARADAGARRRGRTLPALRGGVSRARAHRLRRPGAARGPGLARPVRAPHSPASTGPGGPSAARGSSTPRSRRRWLRDAPCAGCARPCVGGWAERRRHRRRRRPRCGRAASSARAPATTTIRSPTTTTAPQTAARLQKSVS